MSVGLELDVHPGELIAGKYRVERVLGQGAMGVVVSAHHEQLDRHVAIKFLLPGMFEDADAVTRFTREAQAAVKITSEHVARVFDVGVLESGVPYTVMELLEGEDLSALSARGPLPIEDVVDFVIQACVAIAEAHGLGIVHRDLKPANLFCVKRADGQPLIKVLDFGISKDRSRGGASATSTSAVMGTPLYMSPEQMESAKAADAQSDIWAMGVILFELLAGRVPFAGKSAADVALKVATLPPPSLRGLRADVPVALEAAVNRCLEKSREGRYRNVAELALALADFAPTRTKPLIDRITATLDVARTPHLAAEEVGTIIAGRFRLEALVGSGGMGIVWRATAIDTGAAVALKFLRRATGLDDSAKRRMRREAMAAAAVRHPNVVRIHEVVMDEDGRPIIVMELLSGETLHARLVKKGVLDLSTFAELFLPVVSAVGTAHAAGVVHRDLKPENIWLVTTDAGATSPRVLDFGIAKMVGPNVTESAEALTTTGSMLGTPRYMAPEQVFGDGDVDHRVDVWSLGVIAYECLSGKRPVPGDNVWQVLRAITAGDIAPLNTVAPSVPPTIAKVVMRMLSVDRNARPDDVTELFDALRPYSKASAPSFPHTAALHVRVGANAKMRPGRRVFFATITAVLLGVTAFAGRALVGARSSDSAVATAHASTFPPEPPAPVITVAAVPMAVTPDPSVQSSSTPPVVVQRSSTPLASASASHHATTSPAVPTAVGVAVDQFHGLAVDAPF